MRNNSAECCIGKADGVFRVREIRRLQPQSRWDKKVIKNVIGVLRRKTDSRWTVGRPKIRANPIPIPPLPLEGTRFQRERVNKQDIDEFEAIVVCLGCNAVKDSKRVEAHSHRRRVRIEECFSVTRQEAETLDRGSEVINGALAEEVQREEQRKEIITRVTTAAPEPTLAASTPLN